MKFYSMDRKMRYRESAANPPMSHSYVTIETWLVRNNVIRMYRMMRRHGIAPMVARIFIYNMLSNVAIQPNSLSWHYRPEKVS